MKSGASLTVRRGLTFFTCGLCWGKSGTAVPDFSHTTSVYNGVGLLDYYLDTIMS